MERHGGLQADTVGARYGFHRAGIDVRLLELLELLICYWLLAIRGAHAIRDALPLPAEESAIYNVALSAA